MNATNIDAANRNLLTKDAPDLYGWSHRVSHADTGGMPTEFKLTISRDTTDSRVVGNVWYRSASGCVHIGCAVVEWSEIETALCPGSPVPLLNAAAKVIRDTEDRNW